MPRTPKTVSPRVKKAARLLEANPNLTNRQAMLAVEYTPERIRNDPQYREKKRKQIHRHLDKNKNKNEDPSNLPSVVEEPQSDVHSPITETSSSSQSTTTTTTASQSTKLNSEPDLTKKIRKTSKQAQQHRINKKKELENWKNAVKAATSMFALNKEKNHQQNTTVSCKSC